MNTNKVKSLMALNSETQKDLAKILGITVKTTNNKLSGKNEFTSSELEKLSKHYRKSVSYFFN